MTDTLLTEIEATAVFPALELLGMPRAALARIEMLAIGLQESRFLHRRQMGNGPAMGFWQFERGGGVKGVLNHHTSKDRAHALCLARGVDPVSSRVWSALEHDDVLAAGFARLLLLTDPQPLPATQETGWAYYLRTWRPGKPHPETWPAYFARAEAHVHGE